MDVNFALQHLEFIRSRRDSIIPTIYTRHLIPEHERVNYSWNIVDPEWPGPNKWCALRVFEGLVYRLDVPGLHFNLDLIKAHEILRQVGKLFDATPYTPAGFQAFFQEQLAPHLSDEERRFLEDRPWSLSMLRRFDGSSLIAIDGRRPIDCIQEAIFTNPHFISADLEPWQPYFRRFKEANSGLGGMLCELNFEVMRRALLNMDAVGWIADQVEKKELPDQEGYMTLARSPHLSEAQVLEAARRCGTKFVLNYDKLNFFVGAGPNAIMYDYDRIRAAKADLNASIADLNASITDTSGVLHSLRRLRI